MQETKIQGRDRRQEKIKGMEKKKIESSRIGERRKKRRKVKRK